MRQNNLSGRIFDFFNYSFMLILGLLFLYPFWDQLMISLSIPKNADSIGLRLFTWPFTFDAYRSIFKSNIVYVGYFNTVLRTVTGTSISVIMTYFGAYALSKRQLPLRNFITIFILFTMFFSGGLIPIYLNIRDLGLMNSRWALILPLLTSAWHLILCRNFIMTLPKELEDSAMINGANPITMIFYIMLPLSTPILAVISLWVAFMHWNAFLIACFISGTARSTFFR